MSRRKAIWRLAKSSNLLINVGPQPDGNLPQAAVARLAEMGEWMNVNGESVYGCGAAVKPEVRDGNLVVTLGQLSPSADHVVRLSF